MTTFINTQTNEYPVHDYMIRREQPNTSFGPVITPEAVTHMGYAPVTPTERPTGDVVTEVAPILVDGEYFQKWESRDFNSEEIAATLERERDQVLSSINQLTQNALVLGAEFNFGSEETPDVGRVAMADGDRVNILGLKQAAEREVSRGTNGLVFVRCTDNRIKAMTPEKTIELSWAVYDAFTAVMGASWVFQQRATDATTSADLPELPVTL